MVRKVFSFISKEIGGLHEAAYLLALFALLSQILALVRDRLLAYTFGASHSLDVYYAAFRIPDFIFVSIASVVSISVLIPFLMERVEKGEKEVKEFVDAIFTMFFFLIGTVAIIAYILAPHFLKMFFPTFTGDFNILVTMTRIMLLSPVFLGFSNFLSSITQVYKRFFIYALSPIVYNMGIIIGIVFLYPLMGITGLAWGVAGGAFLHCFIQVPFVMKQRLFPRFSLRAKFESVKRVILVSLPRTLTVSSNEIAEFFLISMASTLTGGAISVFNLAWNLQSVPLSIIGVSYSLAAFPMLTKLFTTGEQKKFVDQMVTSSRHILFWSIPIMTLFVVVRAQIVRVILGSGHFNWADTRLTAAALAIFVISLIPQSLTLLFVRAYYSRGDTKKPLLMNAISAGLIIVFSFGLIHIYHTMPFFRYFIESMFRVSDIPGTVVLMLPLGFSLGAIVNMLIHWIAFELDFRGYTRALSRSLFEVLSSSIIMGYISYLFLNIFATYFNLDTFMGVFLQGFLAGTIGIVMAIALLMIFENQELIDIARTLHKKIWKVKVVPPDSSV